MIFHYDAEVEKLENEVERLRAERDALLIKHGYWREEAERLRAERDALLAENERLLAQNDAATIHVLTRQVERLRAANAAMLAALKECAEDLEASIEAEYKDTLDYPSQQRRYERDIEPVHKARAAIKLAEGE